MIDASGEGRSRADYALAYAARGWAVVPLYWVDEHGECGCGLAHDGQTAHRRADGTEFVLSPNSRAKHPHTLFAPHGALSASKNAEQLRRWFANEPRLNIGVATGEISGIVVVDIDPRDGGDTTWSDFVDRNGGQVPDTVIANTGGGGQHVVFQYVADQVIRSPGKGVQVKGNGGYVRTANFVSIDSSSNGATRTATYEVKGPKGRFNRAHNGLYTIWVVANQVRDTTGNFIPAQQIAAFTVRIPKGVTSTPLPPTTKKKPAAITTNEVLTKN